MLDSFHAIFRTLMQIAKPVLAVVDGSKIASTTGAVSITAGFKPPDTKADLDALELVVPDAELPDTFGSHIVNIAFGGGAGTDWAAGGAFAVSWLTHDVGFAPVGELRRSDDLEANARKDRQGLLEVWTGFGHQHHLQPLACRQIRVGDIVEHQSVARRGNHGAKPSAREFRNVKGLPHCSGCRHRQASHDAASICAEQRELDSRGNAAGILYLDERLATQGVCRNTAYFEAADPDVVHRFERGGDLCLRGQIAQQHTVGENVKRLGRRSLRDGGYCRIAADAY